MNRAPLLVPKQDIATGAWHAAYWSPTQQCFVSSEECPTKEAAAEACQRHHRKLLRERSELLRDAQLRGVRYA